MRSRRAKILDARGQHDLPLLGIGIFVINLMLMALLSATVRKLSFNYPLAEILFIRYLAALSNDDIVHRTQTAIIDLLPSGQVSDEKVARKLFLSERSLQRKLQQTGTSFRKLLDTTREELAKQYIQDPSVDLTEIAFLLGFSEHSSFSRAFKRWTGNTPSETRRAAVHF